MIISLNDREAFEITLALKNQMAEKKEILTDALPAALAEGYKKFLETEIRFTEKIISKIERQLNKKRRGGK